MWFLVLWLVVALPPVCRAFVDGPDSASSRAARPGFSVKTGAIAPNIGR